MSKFKNNVIHKNSSRTNHNYRAEDQLIIRNNAAHKYETLFKCRKQLFKSGQTEPPLCTLISSPLSPRAIAPSVRGKRKICMLPKSWGRMIVASIFLCHHEIKWFVPEGGPFRRPSAYQWFPPPPARANSLPFYRCSMRQESSSSDL